MRVSGSQAADVLASLGVTTLPEPRRLVRRSLSLGDGQVEDGLVAWMPGPRSFTGEDVVELHVHAGQRNVRAVVEACLRGGGTAAGAGDFSRRAFELGALSLDQAEGIAAVIGARSEAALAQARRLAGGELGAEVDALRTRIVELRAEVEANLDFPEDVESEAMSRWAEEVAAFSDELGGWLQRFEAGRRARAQPRVVLAGPVNAGKSSLFNALLGRARALVSDEAGTTRDYVEGVLNVDDFAATLVDTAGLRRGAGPVESAGVELSREQIDSADVVVWAEAADADASQGPVVPEGTTVIRVETKRDLGERRPTWLGASVGRAGGVDAVRAALRAWFRAGVDAPWIGLQRHRDRAEKAGAAVAEAAWAGLVGGVNGRNLLTPSPHHRHPAC